MAQGDFTPAEHALLPTVWSVDQTELLSAPELLLPAPAQAEVLPVVGSKKEKQAALLRNRLASHCTAGTSSSPPVP